MRSISQFPASRTVAFVIAASVALAIPVLLGAQSTSVVRRPSAVDRRLIDRARLPQTESSAITAAASTARLPVGSTVALQPPPQSGAGAGLSGVSQGIRLKATIVANDVKRVTPLTSAAAQPGISAFGLPIVFTSNAAKPTVVNPHPGPVGTPAPAAEPTAAFQPRIEVDSFGLAWQTQTRRFSGVVQLYIVDTLHPMAPPASLPTPILFHVSGDGASVDPESPQLASTNVFSKINVSTARMDSLVHLHITPYGFDTPIDINLRLSQAPLIIALGDTMPGLGFGRRDAMISFPAGFSAASDSIDVALTPHNGTVSPEHVWVTPVRPGHAIFRSSGLGSGMLTAQAVGFAPSSSSVPYALPIGFFLAAIAGVAAGTLAVIMFRKESKDQLPKVQVFFGGLVTGFVAAIAGSLLGVKIVDFEPGAGSGLIAVFLLAVVGAWAGPKILSLIAPGVAASEPAKP